MKKFFVAVCCAMIASSSVLAQETPAPVADAGAAAPVAEAAQEAVTATPATEAPMADTSPAPMADAALASPAPMAEGSVVDGGIVYGLSLIHI